MTQLDTFTSYFSRLVTIQDFAWVGFIWLVSLLVSKGAARKLGVSQSRYRLISLAFAGVIGLSLRFWVATGTLSTFWLIAPENWASGFQLNANFVLNVCLYIPPATLLILARKPRWQVAIALTATSFTIETIQQYARIGQGDPMDLLANCVGAFLGIAAGAALSFAFPRLATTRVE